MEGGGKMRRPAAGVWMGMVFGIAVASDRLNLWMALACLAVTAVLSSKRLTVLLIGVASLGSGMLLVMAQAPPVLETPHRVEAVGVVDRYSALSDSRFVFHARAVRPEGDVSLTRGLPNAFTVVFKPGNHPVPEPGRYYRVIMEIQSASPRRNPGMFDYRQHLNAKGILFQAQLIQMEDLSRPGHPVIRIREMVRRKMLGILVRQLGSEQGLLAAAMILGDTSELDPGMLESFRQTGTAHILAVSGLHFGILFTGTEMALDRLKIPYHLKKILLYGLLMLFLGLVGLKASALRAAGMLVLSGLLNTGSRGYDRLNSLAIVGVLILAFRPAQLFEAGYQMSMAAVFGITAIWPVILKSTLHSGPFRKMAESLALSVAVLIATALPSVFHFNTLPLISVAVNVPVVALTGIALPLVLLTVLLEFLPMVSSTTGWLSGLCLGWIHQVVLLAERSVPMPGLTLASPGLAASLVILAGLLLFFLRKTVPAVYQMGRVQLLCIFIMMTTAAVTLPLDRWLKPFDEVLFFDVGQGDSALIRTRHSEFILIDTGDGKAFRETELLLLKSGVSRLDLMVLTHPHADHIGGAVSVLKSLKVQRVALSAAADPKAYQGVAEAADQRGVEVISMAKGDTLRLKGGFLNVLSPDARSTGLGPNEASIVMTYETGDLAFLFTGDITARQEYAIMDQMPEAHTVLKVAHHGSKTSSHPEFVKALNPALAVISVGRNSFGHPSASTLETLETFGILTARTDQSGCVTVRTNGKILRWHRLFE
jgi:competence protein ComEC